MSGAAGVTSVGLLFGIMLGGISLAFGGACLWMVIQLIRQIFGPVTIHYNPKQLNATKKALGLTGEVGGDTNDEAEFRYRASGGYGGEFIDDFADGSNMDFANRSLGSK